MILEDGSERVASGSPRKEGAAFSLSEVREEWCTATRFLPESLALYRASSASRITPWMDLSWSGKVAIPPLIDRNPKGWFSR